MDLQDLTAVQLADALEIMPRHPHNTGGLSLLDEATLAFGRASPNLAEAQRAFADARHTHLRSYTTVRQGYSETAWENAMAAAVRLAAELRLLGDMRITRCKKPAGWGTCNLPLDADGTCHNTDHERGAG